ncbi:VanZ family protein [Streptomyces sp. J2-1]|uniref:VanZ family protein n=1 Tax=Streptomyces corallincola TaxID=2851888 RepID=UPI001C387232|nr:VanZ family protein [Streptomyces corallincola]MBV2355937.1 VanZ family protein [Streptomyces corallincola]
MQRQGSIGGSAAIRIRVAGGVLLVAHLTVVAWLMLRPLNVPWVAPANLTPLAGIRADLSLGWPEAARRLGEGLALLAPLGVLLPAAHGRTDASPLGSLIRTAAAGTLVSLGIALLQTGVPGRVVDVDSVLLNTAGVVVAHLAVVPSTRARLRRLGAGHPDPEGSSGEENPRAGALGPLADRPYGAGRITVVDDVPQGRTPTIPRVGIAP